MTDIVCIPCILTFFFPLSVAVCELVNVNVYATPCTMPSTLATTRKTANTPGMDSRAGFLQAYLKEDAQDESSGIGRMSSTPFHRSAARCSHPSRCRGNQLGNPSEAVHCLACYIYDSNWGRRTDSNFGLSFPGVFQIVGLPKRTAATQRRG